MFLKKGTLEHSIGIFFILLLSSALICYIILGYFGAMIFAAEGHETEFWVWPHVVKRVTITLFLLVSIIYAVGLVEGRKVVALYLRRFRKNVTVIDPTDRGGLGRKIRLVTLQDYMFPAFSLTLREKLILFAVPAFFLLLTFLLLNISNSDMVLTEATAPFWYASFLYNLYIIWLVVFIIWFTFFHIIRLRFRSLIEVSQPSGVESARRAVNTLRSWWLRPSLFAVRSTIAQTNDANWKAMIGSLLDNADIVIFDITEMTENMLWELQEINARNVQAVLIGDEIALQTFKAFGTSNEPYAELITNSVNKFPFREYSSRSADSLNSFRIGLSNLLYGLSNKPTRVELRHSDIFLTALSYIVLAVLAGVLSTAFVYSNLTPLENVLQILMPS